MFINSDTNLDNFELLDALSGLATAGHLEMPRLKSYTLDEVPAAFAESATGQVVGKLVINVTSAK